MASPFCTINTPDYVQLDCGVERSGIVAFFLVDRTVGEPSTANLISNTWYNTLLNQSPALGFLVKDTKGSLPVASRISEDGFGRDSKQQTGADHTATLKVQGILNNRNFWEAVNRKKWKVIFITAGDEGYFVNDSVSVNARIDNPEDIKAQATWDILFEWSTFDNPRVFDASAVTIFQD